MTEATSTDRPLREARPGREAMWVWTASIALTAIFGLVGLVVPVVAENLLGVVAVIFLYLPIWTLDRRRVPLADYGLRWSPIGRGLAHLAGVTLLVLGPYVVIHHYWAIHVLELRPLLGASQLQRFDTRLDGRPSWDAPTSAPQVWVEGPRLYVVWAPSVADAALDVKLPGGLSGLAGVAVDAERRLISTGRPPVKVEASGVATFTPASKSGGQPTGFSVLLPASGPMTLSGTDATISAGRHGTPVALPFETSRSSWWWIELLAMQLVLVALPEEWFYRGYLQARLDESHPRRWRILGADLGVGWLLGSVLFALGHLVLDARVERLAVFFPSLLFGWLRARTGSVMASTLFHALCNVLAQTLGYLYW
ncbi:MAG: CPBP family intramembrane metalloprotease [Myxococcales bacterium]|nr:CPBP family intramembrane metalloprotease [Myxococcales bacterium]